MARILVLILSCLLLQLLFESESRKLLRVPDKLCTASATPTHEENMKKEECKGKNKEHSNARRWMEAHTDYIYTQDLEP